MGQRSQHLGISLRRRWIIGGGIQDGGLIVSTLQTLQDLPDMVHSQGLEHELHLGDALGEIRKCSLMADFDNIGIGLTYEPTCLG